VECDERALPDARGFAPSVKLPGIPTWIAPVATQQGSVPAAELVRDTTRSRSRSTWRLSRDAQDSSCWVLYQDGLSPYQGGKLVQGRRARHPKADSRNAREEPRSIIRVRLSRYFPTPCGSGGTADALASGASWGNPVEVQILSSAPEDP
jgi:hypothetical protein